MYLLAVTDIFGRTVEFEQLMSKISPRFSGTVLLDPYGGELLDFESEKEAYLYFQHHVGLERYAKTVLKALLPNQEESLLLGFSVGASAIWAISEEQFHRNTKAICFYGSQIRHQLDITPSIEIDLYFPSQEEHFDVTELISRVSEKKDLHCFHTKYYHGFMNKKSVNYDESGCDHYTNVIKNSI